MRQPYATATTILFLTLGLACAPAEEEVQAPATTTEPAPGVETPATDAATRAAMARIVEALRVALPPALDAKRFADPANREPIRAALADLASSTAALEAHQDLSDPEAGFLSRSLASDATDVAARFDAGRHDEARFLMNLLVDNCFACHSRTPDVESRDLGALLLDELDTAGLEPQALAQLQVATRRFEDAILTWDNMFRADSPSPAELARRGLIVDYLIVAIRVLDDLELSRQALQALAERDATPELLKQQLLAWAQSLTELAQHPPAGSPLEMARALIDAADQRSSEPYDAAGLVHEILASAHLHRFLATDDSPAEERAEAFYLLGLVESQIRQSGWILQAEFYLETAIRTAPGGPFARNAYDLLEQELQADYGGSAGAGLPDAVHGRLAALADLIDAADAD